jgi:hypothetical protein
MSLCYKAKRRASLPPFRTLVNTIPAELERTEILCRTDLLRIATEVRSQRRPSYEAF